MHYRCRKSDRGSPLKLSIAKYLVKFGQHVTKLWGNKSSPPVDCYHINSPSPQNPTFVLPFHGGLEAESTLLLQGVYIVDWRLELYSERTQQRRQSAEVERDCAGLSEGEQQRSSSGTWRSTGCRRCRESTQPFFVSEFLTITCKVKRFFTPTSLLDAVTLVLEISVPINSEMKFVCCGSIQLATPPVTLPPAKRHLQWWRHVHVRGQDSKLQSLDLSPRYFRQHNCTPIRGRGLAHQAHQTDPG